MKKVTAEEEHYSRDADKDGKVRDCLNIIFVAQVTLEEFLVSELGPDYKEELAGDGEKVSQRDVDGGMKGKNKILFFLGVAKEFQRYDDNKDGVLTPEEFLDFASREREIAASAQEFIAQIDTDGDGVVSIDELIEDTVKHPLKSLTTMVEGVNEVSNLEYVMQHPLVEDWVANSGMGRYAGGEEYDDEEGEEFDEDFEGGGEDEDLDDDSEDGSLEEEL
jgi:hypothetical protein